MQSIPEFLKAAATEGHLSMLGGHYRWPGRPDGFAVTSIRDILAADGGLGLGSVHPMVFLDDIGASESCAAGVCGLGTREGGAEAMPALDRWAAAELPELERDLASGRDGWMERARRLRDALRGAEPGAFVAHPAFLTLAGDEPFERIGVERWLEALETALYLGARPRFRPLLLAREVGSALPPVLLERSITNAASRTLHRVRKDGRQTGLAVDKAADGSLAYRVRGFDHEWIDVRHESTVNGEMRGSNRCAGILAQLFFKALRQARGGGHRRGTVFYIVPCNDRRRLADGMAAFFEIFRDLEGWFGLERVTLASAFYMDPGRSELLCTIASRHQGDDVTSVRSERLRLRPVGPVGPVVRRVYADNNATTPMDPAVLEAMMPYMEGAFGNPASAHSYGWEAEHAVAIARSRVADLIGARPDEIFFTSGATEANNWILKSWASQPGAALLTSPLEHKAVCATASALAASDTRLCHAPVQADGTVDPEALEPLIAPGTLVSLMAVNNEIHTRLDLAAVGALCRAKGATFHTDAAQALGHLPVDVTVSGVQAMSMSAHKLHGPKGIGALYVAREVQRRLIPLLHGGGQESGLRSGTLATPLIVGFGAACAIAAERLTSEAARLTALSTVFLQELAIRGVAYRILGPVALERRRPGSLCLLFPGLDATRLCETLPEIAVSQSSACNTQGTGSHVLAALGLSMADAQRVVRLSFGRFNSREDAVHVAARLAEACGDARRKATHHDHHPTDGAPAVVEG